MNDKVDAFSECGLNAPALADTHECVAWKGITKSGAERLRINGSAKFSVCSSFEV